MSLERTIDDLWADHEAGALDRDVLDELDAFLDALEAGEIRAAEPAGDGWRANEWVKRGILLNFALRETVPREYGGIIYHDVLPLRHTDDLHDRGTRNTPDGTVVRRGAYIGGNAILMSPSFVNVGAYVGDGTLVDSCDTVGSCAQIGDEVKLGANTLVGGVLEPVEDAPVVIEDGASIGAGCRITSGFRVGADAVVGENTLLTPRIPVYDLVADEILHGHLPAGRRAFTRFVASSVADHPLFEGQGAYKPAVVATDLDETTLEGVAREDALRDDP